MSQALLATHASHKHGLRAGGLGRAGSGTSRADGRRSLAEPHVGRGGRRREEGGDAVEAGSTPAPPAAQGAYKGGATRWKRGGQGCLHQLGSAARGGGCLDEHVEGVVSDAEVDGPLRRAFARSLLDLELVLAARQARGTSETKSRSAK